jgi:hypothetical protein
MALATHRLHVGPSTKPKAPMVCENKRRQASTARKSSTTLSLSFRIPYLLSLGLISSCFLKFSLPSLPVPVHAAISAPANEIQAGQWWFEEFRKDVFSSNLKRDSQVRSWYVDLDDLVKVEGELSKEKDEEKEDEKKLNDEEHKESDDEESGQDIAEHDDDIKSKIRKPGNILIALMKTKLEKIPVGKLRQFLVDAAVDFSKRDSEKAEEIQNLKFAVKAKRGKVKELKKTLEVFEKSKGGNSDNTKKGVNGRLKEDILQKIQKAEETLHSAQSNLTQAEQDLRAELNQIKTSKTSELERLGGSWKGSESKKQQYLVLVIELWSKGRAPVGFLCKVFNICTMGILSQMTEYDSDRKNFPEKELVESGGILTPENILYYTDRKPGKDSNMSIDLWKPERDSLLDTLNKQQ